MQFSNRQRSCTCGSAAAFRSTVVPLAKTAELIAFSVPVTEGSSRKTSAPRRPDVLRRKPPLSSTVAPRALKARKCVSIRRRPITSPPGGGSSTFPKRPSRGPARRSEPRMRAASSRPTWPPATPDALTRTVLRSVHSASAPREARISSRVSTSRIRGTLCSTTSSVDNTAAQRQGSAAFLFPAGRILPLRGRPPSTTNVGIGSLDWSLWIEAAVPRFDADRGRPKGRTYPGVPVGSNSLTTLLLSLIARLPPPSSAGRMGTTNRVCQRA